MRNLLRKILSIAMNRWSIDCSFHCCSDDLLPPFKNDIVSCLVVKNRKFVDATLQSDKGNYFDSIHLDQKWINS